MVEQLFFLSPSAIPALIHQQIVDFLRIEWPEGFVKENRLRNWITREKDHPVNFVLVENGVLIAHLEVVWKYLQHTGITYKTYGLTGVFTYPQFRKQGHGLRLLKAAKEYIEKQDGDIVMFNSDKTGFYEKAGFERMDKVITLKGEESAPEKDDESAFMMFLSEKGKKGREQFQQNPVYFGTTTW